jgi:hypothetical protein
MSKIVIENASERTGALLRAAITSQLARLQASAQTSRARLQAFQARYGRELSSLAAEDLDGGDLEYVEWAGEAELLRRLEADVRHLKEIEIVHR